MLSKTTYDSTRMNLPNSNRLSSLKSCRLCRQMHWRCDAAKPICDQCNLRSLEGTYEVDIRRASFTPLNSNSAAGNRRKVDVMPATGRTENTSNSTPLYLTGPFAAIQPPLIAHPFELMHHFVTVTCHFLAPAASGNVYLSTIYPMARSSSMVRHALCLLSAIHLALSSNKFEATVDLYKVRIFGSLGASIRSLKMFDTSVFATIVLLSIQAPLEGDVSSWETHLKGASEMISQLLDQEPEDQHRRLFDIFFYHNALALIAGRLPLLPDVSPKKASIRGFIDIISIGNRSEVSSSVPLSQSSDAGDALQSVRSWTPPQGMSESIRRSSETTCQHALRLYEELDGVLGL